MECRSTQTFRTRSIPIHRWYPSNGALSGHIRRSFEVPDEWRGMRVVLHLGSVKSAAYVWVNGQEVGFTKGSKTPSEFDLTRFVRFGESNSLAIEVYRFSDGAYLEGQDYWKISGLERDVLLFALPEVHIADFEAKPEFDADTGDGRLTVESTVASRASGRAVPHRANRSAGRAGSLGSSDPTRIERHRRGGCSGGRACLRADRSPRTLDGRDPESLHPGPRAVGRVRKHRRGGRQPDRFPGRPDRRRPAQGERRADHDSRCEPPRARSAHGARDFRSTHAGRDRGDEGVQHQRGPHQPLPGPRALVRADRFARPVDRGRGERRIARHGLPARGDAGERSGVARGAPRPHDPHGRA